MNATEAQTATKLVTDLKNANYGDKILVRFCNETVRIIKNLKKEEASTTAPNGMVCGVGSQASLMPQQDQRPCQLKRSSDTPRHSKTGAVSS